MGNQATTKKLNKEGNDQVSRIETGKKKVADKLAGTAEAMHSKVDTAEEYLSAKTDKAEELLRRKTYEASDLTKQTLERANRLGHQAAEAIESSSEFVKEFDPEKAKRRALVGIRKRPELTLTVSVLFGMALGFLLGRRKS